MIDEDVPEHFKEVVKGSVWNLAGNVFFKAVSFFYYILVARMVSQGQLDLFFLSMGIITLFDSLDDFGLRSSISSFIPFLEGRGEKSRVKSLVVTGYAVSLLSSLAMCAIVFTQAGLVASIYHNAQLAAALQTLCLMLILGNLNKITNAFQQSQKNIKGLQALSNMQNLLKLVMTAIMFNLYGPTFFSLAVGALGSTALSLAIMSPIIIKQLSALPGRFFEGGGSIQLFSEVISFGLALSAVTVAGSFLFSTDIALLGYFFGPSTGVVAVYAVAASLALALTVLPFSMDAIFSPLMAGFHGKMETDKMAETIDAAVRWALLISIPPAIVFLVLPEYLLVTVFGDSYAGGAAALSIMVVSMVVSALSHPVAVALGSMRMVSKTMKVYIPAGILFVLLTLVLTPSAGILGPCIAGLVANVFMLFAYRYEISSILRLRPLVGSLKMFLGGALVLAVILASKPLLLSLIPMLPSFPALGALQPYADKSVRLAFLLVPSAAALVLFGAVALLLRCFHRHDVSLLERAMQKFGMPANIASMITGLVLHGVTK